MMESQQQSMSLFQATPIEKTIIKHKIVQYRPSGPISEGSTIEFNVPGTATDYINLKKSKLHVKAKVTKADGTTISPLTDVVGLVNLSLHSLFRQIDVNLQQKNISPDIGSSYPYKAMLDVLLHTDLNETKMESEFFFKDDATVFDAVDPKLGGNGGLLERWGLTGGGREVSMEGPLRVDICQQEREIINGVPICVKLYPSSHQFRLMTGGEEAYKVIITDAILKVYQVEVNPEVMIAHNEALKIGPALYPIKQSQLKCFGIAKGAFTHTIDGLFNGGVPTSIVVGLVSSEAYAGSYKKNYANFANYGLNFLEFSINGNSVPTTPFQPDYINYSYTSEFLSLFDDNHPERGVKLIRLLEYPDGYCLYVFNINSAEENLRPSPQFGHTRLSMRFAKALPEAVTVVVYALFDATIKIDSTRTVILP